MNEDLRPPYRIQFDNARDPYTARNALGIAGTGTGLITSVTAPLAVTGGNLTIDLSAYGDVFLAANNTFTGNNYFAGTSKVHVIGHTAVIDSTLSMESHGGRMGNTNWETNANLAGLNFRKSRGGGTPSTQGLVSTGDGAQINFAASDGSNFIGYAAINGVTEATPAAGVMPGALTFLTRASGGANTLRMTIDSTGLVTIAGNSTSANYPAGAWTAWTPTITASSGTFTTTTINLARYTQHGKTVIAHLDVTTNTIGTAAGALLFTLPVAASASGGGAIYGRESGVNGILVGGNIDPSATTGIVVAYHGGAAFVANARIKLIATYEVG